MYRCLYLLIFKSIFYKLDNTALHAILHGAKLWRTTAMDLFRVLKFSVNYERTTALHGLVGPPGTHQLFFYWNDGKINNWNTVLYVLYNSWNFFNNELKWIYCISNIQSKRNYCSEHFGPISIRYVFIKLFTLLY